MADDEHDPLSWIARYLGDLPGEAEEPGDAIPIDEGARWRVEQVEPDRYAVVQEGAGTDVRPDAVFKERQMAYVAAAVFTAFGGPLQSREDLVGAPSGLAAAGEVREPEGEWGVPSFDDETATRLLSALMRNPDALELLLAAADPEVLEQAREMVIDRMIQRGGGRIH